jgi:hypothetical protein
VHPARLYQNCQYLCNIMATSDDELDPGAVFSRNIQFSGEAPCLPI